MLTAFNFPAPGVSLPYSAFIGLISCPHDSGFYLNMSNLKLQSRMTISISTKRAFLFLLLTFLVTVAPVLVSYWILRGFTNCNWTKRGSVSPYINSSYCLIFTKLKNWRGVSKLYNFFLLSSSELLSTQTTLNLLNYESPEHDILCTKEKASTCMAIIQEQQNSVKQLVSPFILSSEHKNDHQRRFISWFFEPAQNTPWESLSLYS